MHTAFRGPGARDGFEAVTRAVSDGRYIVDRTLVQGGPRQAAGGLRVRGRGRRAHRDLLLRDGFVTEEFIDLARAENRSDKQEQRLDELKAQLAQRVLSTASVDVFDAV